MGKNGTMKIGTLARLSGVPPATIQYYINQGILPKPRKTSRNMAYYDDTYVERIRAIKELQKKHYLPLKVIKRILQSEGDTASIRELREIFAVKGRAFTDMTFPVRIPPSRRSTLIARTGISPADMRSLERLRLIEAKDGIYGEDDILIVDAVTRLRSQGFTEDLGFSIRDLEFLRKNAEKIAGQEVRLFSKNLAERLFNAESAGLAQAGIEAMNALFSILNRKFIKRIISDLTEEDNGGAQGRPTRRSLSK